MKNGLTVKFLIGYLAVAVVGFFIVTFASYKIGYNNVLNERTERMQEISNEISMNTMASFYRPYSQNTQGDLLAELKIIAKYSNTRIVILNGNYCIIADTDKDINDMNKSYIYDFNPLQSKNIIYQTGTFHNYMDEDVISVKSVINYGFNVQGYVTVHCKVSDIAREANERNVVCYITYICIFFISFIIFFIYIWDVKKPIKNILKVTREYEKGNFKQQIKVQDPEDEIGQLAASINYVANEIGEIEEFQKQFIANVSHDFRSPLTSIKGYAQAMKDGVIPVEMQEKYFDIVISETERLEKLTKSTLSLNNISKKGVYINRTDFDINKIIKQTIATFEGICKGRKIIFELTFASKEEFVRGDVDKIGQVIYNLVDNAIKFSDNDSKIFISVTERGNQAFISVKDNGIGIPKESLSKIWDRFYKSDLSRGKDKKGTGLGLCIVKEIIQAHNSNIDVISTVGVGTEFVFSLPRVITEE